MEREEEEIVQKAGISIIFIPFYFRISPSNYV